MTMDFSHGDCWGTDSSISIPQLYVEKRQNEQKSKKDVRIWTILLSIFTATAMTFIAGSINGFTSPALVELTQLQDEELKFDTTLSDIFGVSINVCVYSNIDT